jgi:hypothetical protein
MVALTVVSLCHVIASSLHIHIYLDHCIPYMLRVGVVFWLALSPDTVVEKPGSKNHSRRRRSTLARPMRQPGYLQCIMTAQVLG